MLRIRSGAGTNHKIAGKISETKGHKKAYTIVEEKNGWGRLKSGAGWICLNYTEKTGEKKEAFTPYTVKTTCDVLRIRKGAGTGYGIAGKISEKEGHKNKYTIVEESGGWGRLKSGAGWICLSYTKRAS